MRDFYRTGPPLLKFKTLTMWTAKASASADVRWARLPSPTGLWQRT